MKLSLTVAKDYQNMHFNAKIKSKKKSLQTSALLHTGPNKLCVCHFLLGTTHKLTHKIEIPMDILRHAIYTVNGFVIKLEFGPVCFMLCNFCMSNFFLSNAASTYDL